VTEPTTVELWNKLMLVSVCPRLKPQSPRHSPHLLRILVVLLIS